jgi:hypothetical protein
MNAWETSGIVTAISAMVGGSLAVLAGKLWESLDARKSENRFLDTQYFCQLQLSIQLLCERLQNLLKEFGGSVMSSDYRRSTTLYALACPLALERMFFLDGVYPRIHNRNKLLESHLRTGSLDTQLKGFNFHRYDRIALAECAIVYGDSRLRLATYFEFRNQYEKAITRNDEWIKSAQVFADGITSEKYRGRIEQIQSALEDTAKKLVRVTKLAN